MLDYVQAVVDRFSQAANAEQANKMARYMKNNFSFFGIKTPLRTTITKEITQQYGTPDYQNLAAIVQSLYKQPQRELHYYALDLVWQIRKQWKEDLISLLEEMVIQKSWWDTVDMIASKLIGAYFSNFPTSREAYIHQWIASDSLWLQRTALLFQLKYKEKTDVKLLAFCIERVMTSQAFFIQKAIGWALREYAKTDQDWVKQFVLQHPLTPLSKREALKHISS
ncbi:MAG: DNA alkylation repair protein [Thermonemataceae bacterium]